MIKELFTPKTIIFNAIKDKLTGTGIEEINLIFNIINDKYDIVLTNKDHQHLKMPISEDEINMIKRLLIRKITQKFQKENNKDIVNVVIQIKFYEKIDKVELEVFIDTTDKEIIPIKF